MDQIDWFFSGLFASMAHCVHKLMSRFILQARPQVLALDERPRSPLPGGLLSLPCLGCGCCGRQLKLRQDSFPALFKVLNMWSTLRSPWPSAADPALWSRTRISCGSCASWAWSRLAGTLRTSRRPFWKLSVATKVSAASNPKVGEQEG